MKKLLQEFKEFALRGNVMDLAVGVIIGAAFQAIINSLVNDVCQYGSDVFVCDGRGCGNPLWCIFDRSDQFHHYGSDYFPDGKRDERAG